MNSDLWAWELADWAVSMSAEHEHWIFIEQESTERERPLKVNSDLWAGEPTEQWAVTGQWVEREHGLGGREHERGVDPRKPRSLDARSTLASFRRNRYWSYRLAGNCGYHPFYYSLKLASEVSGHRTSLYMMLHHRLVLYIIIIQKL